MRSLLRAAKRSSGHKALESGTHYVYDESRQLIGEYSDGGANSGGTKEYLWLPSGAGSQLVGFISKGETHAVHSDHLGSPRLVTNSKNQAVWQWPYSANGDNAPQVIVRSTAITNNPSSSDDKDKDKNASNSERNHHENCESETHSEHIVLNVRFPGQYYDAESRLHYNGYRYYQPITGRYIQADPIGLGGGMNRFAYVEGNPLNFTDPKGLQISKAPAVPPQISIPIPNIKLPDWLRFSPPDRNDPWDGSGSSGDYQNCIAKCDSTRAAGNQMCRLLYGSNGQVPHDESLVRCVLGHTETWQQCRERCQCN